MQWMDGLGNVVAGESQSSFSNSRNPFAPFRLKRLAAFGTFDAIITEHLDKVLLRIGNILKSAGFTFDDPLGLGRLRPENAASGICSCGSTSIDGISMSQRCGHNFTDDRDIFIVHICKLIYNNLSASRDTAEGVCIGICSPQIQEGAVAELLEKDLGKFDSFDKVFPQRGRLHKRPENSGLIAHALFVTGLDMKDVVVRDEACSESCRLGQLIGLTHLAPCHPDLLLGIDDIE